MPRPSRRSRTLSRVHKRVTTGTKLVYRKRKPKPAHCSNCGAVLKGVPRERPYKIRTTNKSKKRPERMFGGNLCSSCSRKEIIKRNRK